MASTAINQDSYDKERAFLKDLLVACEKDEVEKVEFMQNELKEKGLSVCDYRDGHKSGAIHAAARGGALKTLQYLLSINPEQGGLKNSEGRTPLMAACSSDGSAECVRYLLENNDFARSSVNDSAQGVCAVHLAAALDSDKSLRYLLEIGGADSAAPSQAGTALHWAAGHSNTSETTALLLQSGKIDVNALDPQGCTAIIIACFRELVSIVQLLCQANADLGKYANNLSPLGAAAVTGNKSVAEILLTKGGDGLCLERDPIENLLPIEHAAHAGQVDMVAFLAPRSNMADIDAAEFVKKTQADYEAKQAAALLEEKAADEKANKIKEEGNKLFLEKRFEQAVERYLAASQVPKISTLVKATLLSNVSASWLKASNFEKAKSAAEEACRTDPKFAKAFFRLAQVCAATKDHEGAAHAYYQAYEADKSSKDAQLYLQQFKEQLDLGKEAHKLKQSQ